MSYSVHGSGHGIDPEKAQEAFREFVRALDAATPGDGDAFTGEITGGEWVGSDRAEARPWSITAEAVREETKP
jgi:hypothetical protein